jgi:hypothetical protein
MEFTISSIVLLPVLYHAEEMPFAFFLKAIDLRERIYLFMEVFRYKGGKFGANQNNIIKYSHTVSCNC